jgi:hypothetical protein
MSTVMAVVLTLTTTHTGTQPMIRGHYHTTYSPALHIFTTIFQSSGRRKHRVSPIHNVELGSHDSSYPHLFFICGTSFYNDLPITQTGCNQARDIREGRYGSLYPDLCFYGGRERDQPVYLLDTCCERKPPTTIFWTHLLTILARIRHHQTVSNLRHPAHFLTVT